jgi:hypothetical protein
VVVSSLMLLGDASTKRGAFSVDGLRARLPLGIAAP